MFGLYRMGVGDLVEGMEPVVGVLGQPFEQPRDGVGADVNDGLVGWVSDHLGDVYAPGALLEPFVGQSLELHSIARQAGVCFVYCAGCGRDLDRFVPFSAGAWGAHIYSGSLLCFGWIIPAAGMGVSVGRMWPRLGKLSQNSTAVRPSLQLRSPRDKATYRAAKCGSVRRLRGLRPLSRRVTLSSIFGAWSAYQWCTLVRKPCPRCGKPW